MALDNFKRHLMEASESAAWHPSQPLGIRVIESGGSSIIGRTEEGQGRDSEPLSLSLSRKSATRPSCVRVSHLASGGSPIIGRTDEEHSGWQGRDSEPRTRAGSASMGRIRGSANQVGVRRSGHRDILSLSLSTEPRSAGTVLIADPQPRHTKKKFALSNLNGDSE